MGDVEKIDDVDTVPIHGRDGKERVTVWVAMEAPHRVLKSGLTDDPGLPDAVFYGNFGIDFEAETPPKKDIVTLQGG